MRSQHIYGICARKKKNAVDLQKITVNQKECTLPVDDFITFLCMGRSKSLNSIKSLLRFVI